MNGQFSQFFVTASSVRQPLNYSEPFSLLLYCMESRGCFEGLAWGSPAPKRKKKNVRGNQDSESLLPSTATRVTFVASACGGHQGGRKVQLLLREQPLRGSPGV